MSRRENSKLQRGVEFAMKTMLRMSL